jgi:hypothetical protein
MLLYFFYCPECASHLQAGGEGAFVSANKKVLEEAVAAFPNHTGFAMTTSLALGAHGGDLVKAYEVGVLLPRVLHDAIAEGKAEASFLPPHCWEDAITEGEAEAEATLLPPFGGRAVGWLESDVAACIFRRRLPPASASESG